MNDAERALRGEIIRTCLAMQERGINQGTSGNVSARWNDGMLITPSGIPYETMAPEDIVFMSLDGTTKGLHAPSSEWRFHRDILRERDDINAIVHAHPVFLTGLAILNKDIPAVHYMIAAVGGPTIRCAPYATYGTEELSKNALAALEGRTGCILANHGVIACGHSLDRALWLASEMETLAQQYTVAIQTGTPVVLPDEEIAHVIERFKGYGPKAKSAPADAVETKLPPKVPPKKPPARKAKAEAAHTKAEAAPAPKPPAKKTTRIKKAASSQTTTAPASAAVEAEKPKAKRAGRKAAEKSAPKRAAAKRVAASNTPASQSVASAAETAAPAPKAARKKQPARGARAKAKAKTGA